MLRSGGRWAVLAALLAGVAFAWPTYVRYFGLHPGPMLVGLAAAFVMYLPSVWAIHYVDRAEPEPLPLFWGSVAFVILFAPITSRVMHGIIDAGLLPYWIVVGPMEEVTKLLPLLLLAWLAPSSVNSMRDGIVYGALGGLGFAIVEFGANFAVDGYANEGWGYLRTAVPGRWALGTESHIIWGATAGVGVGYLLSRRGRGWSVPVGLAIVALVMATHGLNDLFGKFIGPLAMVLLIEPALAAGVDLKTLAIDSPLGAALLVYSAVANTLVMNLLLWPVLAWGLLHSRRLERTGVEHGVTRRDGRT
jgi:RsiW-degrading membrane proteinase PrsW (M82 family)